ncbi:MAG: tRNA uridine-5-carboxymethylaminomethyl(34) synthesis enzyme MnmG [Bacilli bacterium]|nr:tRNA uridine-5-carboxymethylaminomethyl(34) synthesis enzyme MnmG [Bacilli bacterium]
MNYDVIVVGGGHAGIEACHATSKIGYNTLLITGNIKNIGDMPCNPSIGGTSKGVIVREIDALGGLMGKIADQSILQMKMLNGSKGPAVRCLRAQADKELYPKNMQDYLGNQRNLTIKEEIVEEIIVENNVVVGVKTSNGERIDCKCLILTTGTYLKSEILRGSEKTPSGPHGEKRSNHLSDSLKKLGFNIIRLKTGTPPRIDAKTVDYTKMKEELGDPLHYSFSFDTKSTYDVDAQEKCYLIYTNEDTHRIINENLEKSSMYGGYVSGVGPRYCPSIEDKIVRFKDKEKHILFLEPQSMEKDSCYYDALYLQGFSTSMPQDVQEKMVHSLKGLEQAKILEYAYAIEYDAIDPLQVSPTLESKIIKNLFTAGQINGTSGYEEAAGQGIVAGINAANKLSGKDPLVLRRDEAYIGVLIDDLVTKGTIEPYRMLTSRAEYRLILRHDNADLRLREYGYEAGLIDENQKNALERKKENIDELKRYIREEKIKKDELDQIIPNGKTSTIYELIKRPDLEIDNILNLREDLKKYGEEVLEEVIIDTKYEGYISKTYKDAEKLKRMEDKQIPEDIDYDNVANLASEARQKLENVRPRTIAQASRISGVNPADISILLVYLKKVYGKNE